MAKIYFKDTGEFEELTIPTIATSITASSTNEEAAGAAAVKSYVDGIVGNVESLLSALL